MDKASVLGDAIKYMKQLQERVKALEEKAKKTTVESVVFVKKYEVSGGDGTGDRDSSNGAAVREPLPEIEARFCDKDVLISIHCEKRKGVLEKIVAEIEKLHLSVVNSSAMTFGDSSLSITIIAQVYTDVGYCLLFSLASTPSLKPFEPFFRYIVGSVKVSAHNRQSRLLLS